MRLDHLLSKEKRDFLKEEILKNSSSAQGETTQRKALVETLAIALFNFEGVEEIGTLKKVRKTSKP